MAKSKSAQRDSADLKNLLFEAAALGLKNSYSPYSKFPVGAAVLTDKGIFYGCNVENASFGGTVCAERVALLKAKSEGAKKFDDVLVLTPRATPVPPCGLCLQTMAEFLSPQGKVYLATTGKGKMKELTLKQLLPESFSRKDLVSK
ncbi:MAG: cytidine deaminase [Bdellovibrionales bacterium]|nr:cytidine deaminase [Bdellovibrionales bacterium]